MLTHLDLFSGMGGFAFAAQANSIRTVQFVEIDARCREFLTKSWPGVPTHGDIRTFRHSGQPVWLLTGGVPCQPVSHAGKRRGAQDDRWLWPEAVRVLAEVRPTWALFENVVGLRSLGLDGILSDLESAGYAVGTFDIPACAVNAPHRRARLWIVCRRMGDTGHFDNAGGTAKRREKRSQDSRANGRVGRDVANPLTTPVFEAPTSGPNDSGEIATARASGDDMADSECCNGEQWRTAGHEETSGYGARTVYAGCTGDGNLANTQLAQWGSKTERRDESDGEDRGREKASSGSVQCTGADPWSNHIWQLCADGKVRRAPDDSFLLADGVPTDVLAQLAETHRSVLSALGNGIVHQIAARIIAAMKEAEES